MKKITSLLVLLMAFAFATQAQFERLEVEELTSVDGYKTYRVYAVLKNKGDLLDAVFGEKPNPITINSTSPFYQHPNGGAFAKDIQKSSLTEFPKLKYDSWVTIGYDNNYMNSVMFFGSMTTDSVAIEKDFRIDFEKGQNILVSDGAWFVTPDQLQARGDDQNRVLLMQLTTKGRITGSLNLHGRWHSRDEEGNLVPHVWEERAVKFTAG